MIILNRYIPDEVINEIRNAADIVDIVSETVRLRKQGNNYVGLCPFHSEKTPSFMVSHEKQIFRCFGCGEGGNVFSFIMKRDSLSFPEAVKALAQKVGIQLPEQENPEKAAEIKLRDRYFKINELAKNFYQYILQNHGIAKDARRYLEQRQISSETIEKFQIGYAPPSWNSLLQFLSNKGFSGKELETVGLVLPRTRGSEGHYDRFRNRIMFPIWNVQGKIVGFGGRVLDDTLPKYLNSPESLLFNKSHNLYGLNKALESIRQSDQVIIVEGYLDVITCHQAGINNVVASLGTALTREQGKLLLRYAKNVIMAYDTDAAGVKATMKGWQLLDELGFRLKVVSMPNGKDPDEFIKNHGKEKFLQLVQEYGQNLCDYQTDRAMEKFDIYTLEGKFKIASEVIPSINNMSNEIEKDETINRLAKRLHLSPEAIRAEVEKFTRTSRNDWRNRDKIVDIRNNNTDFVKVGNTDLGQTGARVKAERTLMSMVLHDIKLFKKVKDQIGITFTENQEYLVIINLLNEIVEKELNYQPASFFDRINNERVSACLSSLMVLDLPVEDKEKVFDDCLKTIKEDETRKRREDLLRQMENADKQRDYELRKKLLLEYSKLI